MKTHYAIALAVVSAMGGAAAVQGLHAQGKPIVYQDARKVGNKYATFRRFAVEGNAN